jgi:hypothetical protein
MALLVRPNLKAPVFLLILILYSLAGTAIVTKDKTYLFTCGRYFLQAEQQLDKSVES